MASRDVHLLAAEDKTLLDRRDAFLLFDAFLYPGDLVLPFVLVKALFEDMPITGLIHGTSSVGSHFIVGFNVELDLLAGERADSVE